MTKRPLLKFSAIDNFERIWPTLLTSHSNPPQQWSIFQKSPVERDSKQLNHQKSPKTCNRAVIPVANTFNFSPITTEKVIEALSQLNPKKAPGINGISVRLLRDTIDVIAEPLANIFNLSFRTAIFPDDWKLAKISPIFKDGTKNDCGNYRPISVISTVVKLFEGIVYHQLRSFIAANNILIDQQSGFRPKHSTETALISSTNEWLLNMDKGFVNGVLFLDLKKAFNTVNHDILL